MSSPTSSSQLLFTETNRTAAPHETSEEARECKDGGVHPPAPPLSSSSSSLATKHSQRSPPPPLDHVALASTDTMPASLRRLREGCSQPATRSTKPHRGVAVAVLNRPLHSHSPGLALEERVGEKGSAGQHAGSTPPPSPDTFFISSKEGKETAKPSPIATASSPAATSALTAEGRPSSLHKPCALREASLAHAFAAAPNNAVQEGSDGTVEHPTHACTTAAMPWWKRILIDVPYRHRLMQISTEEYRREFSLLEHTPDVISGKAGMGKKKVWRERQWWQDELADDVSPLRFKQDDQKEGHVDDSAAHPIKDEVDKTVVMAQHVVFKLPPNRSLSSMFALQHPRAIIQASELETIRSVALGRMPPIQRAYDQERQQEAIDAHLGMQRRLSREMTLASKQRLAKDIVLGREDVPMQTAITDAVLETAGGQHTLRQPAKPSSHRSQALPSLDYNGESASDSESSAAHASFLPPRPEYGAGTPPHIRRVLPRRIEVLTKAQHALNVAAISLNTTALPLCSLRTIAAKAAPVTDKETSAVSLSNSLSDREDSMSSSTKAKMEMHTQQSELRRCEAAMACIDGTENLYGLQYVWRLPLPPNGFIRVSPDPRYAMWPDQTYSGTGKSAHLVSTPTAHNHVGGAGRTHHGASRRSTGYNTIVTNRNRRRRELRRLARRVNKRTRTLRWLHEIGHRSICYNDLALLSDSDTSSLASSCVLMTPGGVDHLPRPHNRNKKLSSLFSLNVVRQLEWRKKHAPIDKEAESAAAGLDKGVDRHTQLGVSIDDAAQPIYDGALNINIYAEVIDGGKFREGNGRKKAAAALCDASVLGFDGWKETTLGGTSPPSTSATPVLPSQCSGKVTSSTNRIFLGCYRQSRMLIHYKVYCRALHEEARVRCGSPLTHVTASSARQDSIRGTCREQPSTEWSFPYDANASALLRSVPVIPYPVLRLQKQPPTLREPHTRHTPVLSTIHEACSWEGLFPSAEMEASSTAHYAWRTLRESALVQQALRDIFEDLPHDKGGFLDKRTFVLFVLQLLEIFFPTHLAPTVHVAIAEEEWAYRGTTEHVGPRTFHEKFFGFPFIFLRDVAAVTETELVEFWSILRVCLRAQQEQTKRIRFPKEAVMRPEDLLASLHLLVPLTSFDQLQLHTLIASPPPTFDPVIYDRFCLLTQAYRSDPVVLRAPRAQQHTIARARVEQQLRLLEAQRQLKDTAKSATGKGMLTSAALTALANEKAEQKPSSEKASTKRTSKALSLPSDLLNISAATASRVGLENAVQREREEQRRRMKAQAKQALLEQSAHYQQRQRRVHQRAAAKLSGIEFTSSSWELHRVDIYEPPSTSTGHGDNGTTALAATVVTPAEGKAEEENEDVEDALLEYLEGVPLDVFDGRVSLRERYLLHASYQHKRQGHELPFLQNRTTTATAAATPTINPVSATTASASSPEAVSGSNTICASDPAREVKVRDFLSMMKGEGINVKQRQHIVAAECERLIGAEAGNSKDHEKVVTTSYAAGMYPLRPVPRTISSIVMPTDKQTRVSILGQKEYQTPDGSEACLFLRKGSDRSAREGSATRQPPRRTLSRTRMKTSLSPLYAVRHPQVCHRLDRRTPSASAGGAGAVVTTAVGSPSAVELRALAAQQQMRCFAATYTSMKRNSCKVAGHRRSFHHRPIVQPLSKTPFHATAEAEASALAASSVPLSRAESNLPSIIEPSSKVAASRAGRPAGQENGSPGPARPSTTVAFLCAVSDHRASIDNFDGGDDEGSMRASSVLLDTPHLSFSRYGDRYMPTVSSVATTSNARPQEELGTVAPSISRSTSYAGRLRAQQRRQQQYKLQFNSATKSKPSTLRR